jgi:hypothetical protein
MTVFSVLFIIGVLIIVVVQFAKRSSDSNSQDLPIEDSQDDTEEEYELSEDQLRRKAKSIAYLKHCQIPVFEHLPCIESEEETTLRTKEEIVERAIALCYIGIRSEDPKNEALKAYEEKYNVLNLLTPDELAFVNAEIPTDQQIADANWRYESLHVLLWSLGLIGKLGFPGGICNLQEVVAIILENSKEELLEKSTLRSKDHILGQADLIYRIHWAVRNAIVNGVEPPKDVNRSVMYERHYALNWLINYMDEDWDHISTDT